MSVILKSGASSNLANVSAAGGLQVDGSAVTQPVSISSTVPVSIASSVPVTIAQTVTVDALNSSTASTPNAQTVGTSSGSILAANASRKEVMVVNTGVYPVYLGLAQTPTVTAYHVALSACSSANDGTGGSWISDMWQGAINAIAATASTVVVTELT